jgi:hypothetical protein
MQTFLPYASYNDSAKSLDYKRLGKQRVEVKQLLLALGVRIGNHVPRANSAWRNHPCAVMWSKYPAALVEYGICVCKEWRSRGYNDILLEQFEAADNYMPEAVNPWWLGLDALHESHKSNLVRKDPKYYAHQFPGVGPMEGYYWPEGTA